MAYDECDCCEKQFKPDETYTTISPKHVDSTGEHHTENMAWNVHWSCVDDLLKNIQSYKNSSDVR